MSEFNPRRLKMARKRRGLTKKALAERVGLTTKALTAHEGGKNEPQRSSLQRLAEALSFPEAFFYRPDAPDPISPLAPTFRKVTTLKAADRDRALGAAEIGVEFDRYLRNRFTLPPVSVPDFANVDPAVAATLVRNEWGLGQKRIHNTVHLLESRGVRVLSLAEDTRKLNAFAVWRDGVPFVFLNTVKTAEQARMDCAHELGHLVLHRHTDNRSRSIEDEADKFAREFLVPHTSLIAAAPRRATPVALRRLKARWGVSAWDLAVCLRKAGCIPSEHQYRSLMIEMQRLGWRDNEPDGRPREISQVLQKVLRKLWTEGMTLPRIAQSLAVPHSDLADLLFGLTLVEVGREPEFGQRRPSLRIL